MVRVGQVFTNSNSGERFVWRATSASMDGEYCEFDLHLSAGAKLAAAHIHPNQTETFAVIRGRIRLRSGRDTRELTEGGSWVIPPGTPHFWGNVVSEPSHVVVRLTPALDIEGFFESFCAITTASRAGSSGLPRNPLRTAVLLDGYRNEFGFPTRSMRLVLGPAMALLAVIGRALGITNPRAAEAVAGDPA